MKLQTPYYLIDERAIQANMRVVERVRQTSGARCVLALKCFASWAVFPLLKKYMVGTTSSSLYEARLGHERFGGETHAYCVGWSDSDMRAVKPLASKVIFNSVSQLERHGRAVRGLPIGLRANPGISHSHFDLADPARPGSRLGVLDPREISRVSAQLSGLMFHCNCENDSLGAFTRILDTIGERYGALLKRLEWASLGGGIYFTKDNYPVAGFCRALKRFADTYGVQVYLEPGESAITRSAQLVTTVVDVVRNRGDIAIVDASTEAHMLDLLIYRIPAKVGLKPGRARVTIAGRSCLAGDIFGQYRLARPLAVGDEVRFEDAAGYTMVKKNWFNGLQMPSIAVRGLDGRVRVARTYDYGDFERNVS